MDTAQATSCMGVCSLYYAYKPIVLINKTVVNKCLTIPVLSVVKCSEQTYV